MPSILKTDSAWTSQTWQVGHYAALLGHVPEPLLEEVEDVLVVERVVDAPSLAAPADDAHAAHQAELVRDRGLADPDALGDLVDAELPGRQGVDDPDARRIAEDPEGIGEGLDQGVVADGARGPTSAHMSNSSYVGRRQGLTLARS